MAYRECMTGKQFGGEQVPVIEQDAGTGLVVYTKFAKVWLGLCIVGIVGALAYSQKPAQAASSKGAARSLKGLAQEKMDRAPILVPVKPTLESAPALCDVGIVEETCHLLNDDSLEYDGTLVDTDHTTLNVAEIAGSLAVQKSSVREFLFANEVPNLETESDALEKGAFSATCQSLCDAIVKSFSDHELPSRSDVACWTETKSGIKNCNIDASPQALESFSVDTENAQAHLNASARVDYSLPLTVDRNESFSLDRRPLRVLLAQMFRIHPVSGAYSAPTIHDDDRRLSRTIHDDVRRLSGGDDDSCHWSKDGVCDELKGYCSTGTDCTDCGSCPVTHDDSCQRGKDGVCDEPKGYCAKGSDCTDCNDCPPVPPVALRGEQNVATCSAWASNGIRKLRSGQATGLMKLWFAESSVATRQGIISVAVSVINVLNSVEVRRGPDCIDGVYAYVHPGEQNTKGDFILFLCPWTVTIPLAEFIGTMYHESSHHPKASLSDVIYGRTACKQLALDKPESAMMNADSHEFFMEDLNSNLR